MQLNCGLIVHKKISQNPPIKIDKEYAQKEDGAQQTVLLMALHHSACMDFGRIIDAHAARRQSENLVQFPGENRCIEGQQIELAAQQE